MPWVSVVYREPSKTSNMERFTICAKHSMSDVSLGFEYADAYPSGF